MRNVYLVSKKTSTSVQRIDIEEAESVLPRELGLRLSSLFMFDRLVFVESPTDENVIREFSVKLGVNLGQANVGFVAMGGVRFLSFFAAEKTLSFLAKRQVKSWIVIDRDEKDSVDVENLRRTIGTQAALKVLERRELENYLITPKAIIEFVKLKCQLSGKQVPADLPSVDEVKQAIQEAAEKLKAFTIQKRVHRNLSKPIYPKFAEAEIPTSQSIVESVKAELQRQADALQEGIQKIEDIYNQESAEVEASWSQKKLDNVPGDMLIDAVCQKYGVRFYLCNFSAWCASFERSHATLPRAVGIPR